MCVFSPIAGATGKIPLFELTQDYEGSTVQVDTFDVGDGGGSGFVDLALLDDHVADTVATGNPST